MESVKDMLSTILVEINKKEDGNDYDVDAAVLKHINRYFYQSHDDNHISPFHEYWEKNYKDILRININREQAKKIAIVFEEIFRNPEKYNVNIKPEINKEGLTKHQIANIRFFTAIQDFKINIYKKGRDPFQEFHKSPFWYTPIEIINDESIINSFLDYLDASGSQGDKRKKWMQKAAIFLNDVCDGDAFNLFDICNRDVELVRKCLADDRDIGFSRKKADMFIRDMIDWEIWDVENNIEKLNVASDSNTMKIALRTGLLELQFPLLTSYLDIYSHQYSYIDKETQEAWRFVWEVWGDIENNHRPPAPVSMDYLIYNSLGKGLCLKNKRKCGKCPLNSVCPTDTRNLKPPKSISIYGQTGWDSGKTDNGGGGGIMA